MKKKTVKKTGPSVAIGAIPSPNLRQIAKENLPDFIATYGPSEITSALSVMATHGTKIASRLTRDLKSKAGGEAKELDYLIQRFLEDYHKKLITKPEINATKDNIVPGNRLVYDFIEAVASGDNDFIRQIAEGVSRVHTRATGRKDSFTITPADQARARVFDHVDKNGPPQSVDATKRLMIEVGRIAANVDDREVRKWHKELGGASGKRGRPSKTKVAPKVEKPAVVSLKEIRARAAAASAKLPRLLDQKPVAKNRTKPRETAS